MKTLLTLFVLFTSFSLIAKEEVLYCTETKAAGFLAKSNYSDMVEFKPERYTIKIDFQFRSLELLNIPFWQCDIPQPYEQMYCTLDGMGFYIDINNYNFTFAKAHGFVASKNDDVIITYGNCEKF